MRYGRVLRRVGLFRILHLNALFLGLDIARVVFTQVATNTDTHLHILRSLQYQTNYQNTQNNEKTKTITKYTI